MKYIIVIAFLFASCTSFSLELQMPPATHVSDLNKITAAVAIIDYGPKKAPEKTIKESTFMMCVDSQVKLYGDLCGEMDTDGSDAHFNGVKCAVESIKSCVEVEK